MWKPSRTWRTPACSVCSIRSGTGWLTSRTTRRPRSGRRWRGRAARRPPTRSSWVPRPSPSLPRRRSTSRCWSSLTTCSGWMRSPRARSPSRPGDSVLTPSRSLLAAREGTVPAELGQGLPVLPVVGLSASAAATLLPTRAAPRVVDRLVDATQGNPLALVEVAAGLDDAQWLGAAQLPDPLPTGDRLREHFRTTLAELSPAARTAVLLLALVGDAGSAAPGVLTALGAARRRRSAAGGLSARRPGGAADGLPDSASTAAQQRARAGDSW